MNRIHAKDFFGVAIDMIEAEVQQASRQKESHKWYADHSRGGYLCGWCVPIKCVC